MGEAEAFILERTQPQRLREPVKTEFSIASWAACAPGLSSQAQWSAWAAEPWLPTGDDTPALTEMPAMARRRLGPIGKTALQAAYWCQAERSGSPVVLASRYGDAERSLALLADLARDEPLSPTAFGLSVHNAIGAQYSIARQDPANYLSVAAGATSAGAALVEAVGLLNDGAEEVLVVCYDEPLPGAYRAFSDMPACRYAWAWRVTPRADRPGFALDWGPAPETNVDGKPSLLPFGLDLLRFTLSTHTEWHYQADGRTWQGVRHA